MVDDGHLSQDRCGGVVSADGHLRRGADQRLLVGDQRALRSLYGKTDDRQSRRCCHLGRGDRWRDCGPGANSHRPACHAAGSRILALRMCASRASDRRIASHACASNDQSRLAIRCATTDVAPLSSTHGVRDGGRRGAGCDPRLRFQIAGCGQPPEWRTACRVLWSILCGGRRRDFRGAVTTRAPAPETLRDRGHPGCHASIHGTARLRGIGYSTLWQHRDNARRADGVR